MPSISRPTRDEFLSRWRHWTEKVIHPTIQHLIQRYALALLGRFQPLSFHPVLQLPSTLQPFPFVSGHGTPRPGIFGPSSAHQDRFLDDGKGPKLASPASIQMCGRCSKHGPGGASSHLSRRSCYFHPCAAHVPWTGPAPGQTDHRSLAMSGTYPRPVQLCRQVTKPGASPQSIISSLAISATIETQTWIFPSYDPE